MRVVSGCLVSHPGDNRSFGPLLDLDTFRPGDRAAPDRSGVIGHDLREPVGKIGVIRMKVQERHHCPYEILDVHSLDLLSSSGIDFLLLGKALRRSLGFEFGTNMLNGRRRGPYSGSTTNQVRGLGCWYEKGGQLGLMITVLQTI